VSAEDTMSAIALPQEQDPDLTREPPGRAVPAPWEQGAEPAGDRFPELVPGLREPVPAEPVPREPAPEPVPGVAGREPGTGAELVPAVAAPQARISLGEHLLLSLRDWAAGAVASQKAHRSFWHWLWEGFWGAQPESLRQHRKHVKSREWLPDYMTGWLRTFAEWENIAYHLYFARPVKAVCNNVSRGVERQPRAWAAGIIAFLAFIVWTMAHH
jgi:hypothetical protein